MRLLFVGETWQGSSARSMREALAAIPDVSVQEVGEDHYLPRYADIRLRMANRLLKPLQRMALQRAVQEACRTFEPDVLVVYKGAGLSPELIAAAKARRLLTVNIFPDYSPHAYGDSLRTTMGLYDLVISTKPFHPGSWKTIYGYSNVCVCVPHGYDPAVHLWDTYESTHDFDVALCATWRPEYHSLVEGFAHGIKGVTRSVIVAGHGWRERRRSLPRGWSLPGPVSGPAYGALLRRSRIVIAPLNRRVIIDGRAQPGDVDTTRSYELAAAYCFFLHQRTTYAQSIYCEHTEVPMWNDARELVDQICRWLPDAKGRHEMAARAHARAVPAYSIPERARSVVAHIHMALDRRR